MLWKLTGFELKKSVGNRFFIIALCLLLLINMLLLCGLREWMEFRANIKSGVIPTDEETLERAKHFGLYISTDGKIANFIRQNYALFTDLTPEELEAFEIAMKEKYGEDIFTDPLEAVPDAMLAPSGYFADQQDLSVILDYQRNVQRRLEVEDACDRAVRAARIFGGEALEKGDNYGVRRNINIIHLYSAPRSQTLTPVRGWDEILFETPTMLLVFLLVLLSCAGSFTGENDRKTWLLLHTAKNGKGKTLAAKYLSGAFTAVMLTVLFHLSSLAAIWFKGGFMGLTEPAVALNELLMIPWDLTVWQYVLLTLACRIFAAVLLSVLLQTISALCRSSVISYGVGAVVLGGCALLAYFPPREELLAGPLSLANPLKYFETYYTANLFGFPVLWAVVQAVLWSALCAISIFLAHKVYHRKRGAV